MASDIQVLGKMKAKKEKIQKKKLMNSSVLQALTSKFISGLFKPRISSIYWYFGSFFEIN